MLGHGSYTLVSAVTFALIQKLHRSRSSAGIDSIIVFVFAPSSSPLSKTMRLWTAVVVFDGELDVKGVQSMRAGASVAEGFPDAANEVQKPIASCESLASLCVLQSSTSSDNSSQQHTHFIECSEGIQSVRASPENWTAFSSVQTRGNYMIHVVPADGRFRGAKE